MTDHGAPDDEALVGSCERGERFETVFELRAKEIWRYLAVRLGAPTADELLSEVFIRAFAARARFDPKRGSARAWLYGIANNLCRERIRSDSQYRQLLQRAEPELGNQTAPDAVEQIADRQLLGAALVALPEERREVVLLIGAVGLSYEETAQALGLPVGTVRSRFFRARRQLRALLQDERSVSHAQRTV